jgi:hypothetical protein
VTALTVVPALDGKLSDLAHQFVSWLETGVRPKGMFADDVLADLSLPQWRVQAEGPEATFHLREDSHPFPGTVRVEGLDATSRGFLLQFEERWVAAGQNWYCREQAHATVSSGRISELVVYCTGDWDEERQHEHQRAVRLVRP